MALAQRATEESGRFAPCPTALIKPSNDQKNTRIDKKSQKNLSRSIAVSKNNPIFVLRRLWTNIQKPFFSTRLYWFFRAAPSVETILAHQPLARVAVWDAESKLLIFTLLCFPASPCAYGTASQVPYGRNLRWGPHSLAQRATALFWWEAALVHNFRRSAGPSSVFWSK